MKKYMYGLAIGGVVSTALGAYLAFGSTTKPDMAIVKQDMRRDMTGLDVEMNGWLAVNAQGKLSDADYRAQFVKDLDSANAKLATYQELIVESRTN